jgi:CBS domain-containing protein
MFSKFIFVGKSELDKNIFLWYNAKLFSQSALTISGSTTLMQPYNIETAKAKDIMSKGVISLSPRAPFSDLIRAMHLSNISAVVIHDENDTDPNYYLCSHSDIITFLYNQGLSSQILGDIPIGLLMKGPVRLLDEELSIDEVVRVMNEKGYKRVIIGKNGKATGVISTRDILLWNNLYFAPGKPIALIIMDNTSSIIIAKHIFESNFSQKINNELIELFGGALTSISYITEETLSQSGAMKQLDKDNYSMMFEEMEGFTGILICDRPSLIMRRQLVIFIKRFLEIYGLMFSHPENRKFATEVDISQLIQNFYDQVTL